MPGYAPGLDSLKGLASALQLCSPLTGQNLLQNAVMLSPHGILCTFKQMFRWQVLSFLTLKNPMNSKDSLLPLSSLPGLPVLFYFQHLRPL